MAAIPGFTQTVSDDFNRANETPLAGNWVQDIGARFNLSSNTVILSSFTVDAVAIWNPWASGNDQYSQIDLTVVGTAAGSGPGVFARHDAVAQTVTGYRFVIDASGNYEYLKFVAGASSGSVTGTVSYVAGQKIGISATGSSPTTIKLWYNGIQIGANITDNSSPITTGIPGISYSSTITSVTLDNWDAGIPAVAGGPATVYTPHGTYGACGF